MPLQMHRLTKIALPVREQWGKTKSTRLPVILPEGAKFLHDAQPTVDVTIQVAKESDTP